MYDRRVSGILLHPRRCRALEGLAILAIQLIALLIG